MEEEFAGQSDHQGPRCDPAHLKRFEAKVDGPLWLSAVSQLPEELAAGLTSAVRSKEPPNSAIKAYIANGGEIEGVTVKREYPPAKLLHP